MSGVMNLRVGTVSAFVLLSALVHRQKTGEGQYIDLSSSECVSALVGSELMDYSMNKRSPHRAGNQDIIMASPNWLCGDYLHPDQLLQITLFHRNA